MNKIFLIVTLLFVLIKADAQAPQKMSYQAVIRNQNNSLISNARISMRVSIIQNGTSQTPVYQEYHIATTNLNGLVSLQIGTGIFVTGDFKKIDWSKGPYFVKTETDPDGAFDFKITGTSELLSVPYALYALNNSVFDTTSLHTRIVNLQAQAIENQKNIEINLDSIKENAKDIKTNLDTIRVNTVRIKNNVDSINSKIDLLDLIAILAGYQKIGIISRAITVEGNDTLDVKSNGNLHSSKNISLTGNIESLGTSSSIGTLEKPFKDLYISSHSLSIASDVVGQNIPPTVLSNLNGNLEISSGGFKLLGPNAAFIAPRIVSTLTGNASTASKLATPRTINGVLFDGSTNIVLPDINYDNKYTKISQLNGTDSFNINIKGNLGSSGNVTVAGNIEALGSTSTLGTIDKPFKGLYLSSGSLSIASDTLGQNVPAAILSNVRGNLEISAGGLKLVGTNEAFIAPRIISTLTGNASTSSKLETARNINGVSFDGSSDISITAVADAGTLSGTTLNGTIVNSSLTSVGTLTNLTVTNPITGSVTGNAATVTTNANLTGIVTSIGNVTSIASGTITNSMLANTAVANLSGTNTGDQILPTLVSLGAVASNSAITGATKTKLTYDAKGLVTAGADATTADIAASTNKNYVTDVQAGVLSNTSGTNTGDQVLPTLVSLGAVASNSAITGATKTKLTYDAKGLVTAGADATTADIAASTNKNYVTDVQAGVLSNTSGTNTGDESTATIKTKLGITTLTGSNTGDQVLPTLISLGAVATNVAITGATKTKLTYDAKGLVTAGADATTADIAASTNKNYVTDVQAGVLSNISGTNTGDQINITGNAATVTTNANLTGMVTSAGNATTVVTNANLTGDVTSVGNTSTIGALKVTNGMIAATTIDLTAKVTGTLPIANGGTNSTATPTAGGINYGTGTSQAYTAVGTSGQFLQSAGAGTPVWVAHPGPSSVTILNSLTPGSTYTVPAGVKAIMVELVGAGGGSGAIIATGGAGKGSVSGGGGSGSYTRLLIVNPAVSYVYTIGVGGTAGTAGGTGGTGGQTLFNGTTVTTFGGVGGRGCLTAVATVVSLGGAGGAIGANGDFSVAGNTGGTGYVAGLVAVCGVGANSHFGGGALASATLGTLIVASTAAATGYGAGASGIGVYANAVVSASGTGAAGYQGVIIITEYK